MKQKSTWFISLFLIFSCLNSFSQAISNEKVLHFTFDGINDTLDLISSIKANINTNYSWSKAYSDTSVTGELNTSIFLESSWIEIPINIITMEADSSISISFWINSPNGGEMLDFFRWNSLVLEHINTFMRVPNGTVSFTPNGGGEVFHFVQIYNKGSYKLYINNELVHEMTGGVNFDIENSIIRIGTQYSRYSIDDLIVYRGVLNETDIESIYNRSVILGYTKSKLESGFMHYNPKLKLIQFSKRVDNVTIYDLTGNALEKGSEVDELYFSKPGVFIVVYSMNGVLKREKFSTL